MSKSTEDSPPTGQIEVESEFSNALIDVWKAKTKKKTSWVAVFDIRAPIHDPIGKLR
jgi:hypothetical protein